MAVLGRPGHQVVGYLLTMKSGDPEKFKLRMKLFDKIEGYEPKKPKSNFSRSAVTAHSEQGEEVQAYMYHRTGINESKPVPEGDWMKRERPPPKPDMLLYKAGKKDSLDKTKIIQLESPVQGL